MKDTIVFPDTEFQVREPLRPYTDVVIVPDSPASLCPAPVAPPVKAPPLSPPPVVKPTGPAVVGLAPIPPAPTVDPEVLDERLRWTGSDYLWFGLVTLAVAVPIGIVATVLYVLAPVFVFLWSVVTFVWSLGPVAGPLVAGLLVFWPVWMLVGRLAHSSGQAPAGVAGIAVGAVAGKPAATVKPVQSAPAAPEPQRQRGKRRSPAERGSVGRFFLGDDRPNSTGSASASPDFIDRGIARMRDRNTGQSVGMWSGGQYDLLASAYDMDIATAVNTYGDDKCAVSWLLHEANPKGWNPRDSRGPKHSSWGEVNDALGPRVVKKIIAMNDSGTRLPVIADYVAKVTGRR